MEEFQYLRHIYSLDQARSFNMYEEFAHFCPTPNLSCCDVV